jgi:hypothetical protein
MQKRRPLSEEHKQKVRIARLKYEATRAAQARVNAALAASPVKAAGLTASLDTLDTWEPTLATAPLQQPPAATLLPPPRPVVDSTKLLDSLTQFASVEKTDLPTVASKMETNPGDLELYLRDHLKTSWGEYHASMVKQAWLTIRAQLLRQATSGDIRSITQLVTEVAEQTDKVTCPEKGSCPHCPQCTRIANMSTAEVMQLAGFVRGPHSIQERMALAPGTPGGYAAAAHIKLVYMPADSEKPMLEQEKPAVASGKLGAVSSPGKVSATAPVTAGLFGTDYLLPKEPSHESADRSKTQ